MSVEKSLEKAMKIFNSRSKTYGKAYLKHGKVLQALFPDGLYLYDERSFAAFGILNMMLAKIERFCNNINKGHTDSMEDMMVYSAMMIDVYDNLKEKD